jgi:hypothetical protein
MSVQGQDGALAMALGSARLLWRALGSAHLLWRSQQGKGSTPATTLERRRGRHARMALATALTRDKPSADAYRIANAGLLVWVETQHCFLCTPPVTLERRHRMAAYSPWSQRDSPSLAAVKQALADDRRRLAAAAPAAALAAARSTTPPNKPTFSIGQLMDAMMTAQQKQQQARPLSATTMQLVPVAASAMASSRRVANSSTPPAAATKALVQLQSHSQLHPSAPQPMGHAPPDLQATRDPIIRVVRAVPRLSNDDSNDGYLYSPEYYEDWYSFYVWQEYCRSREPRRLQIVPPPRRKAIGRSLTSDCTVRAVLYTK